MSHAKIETQRIIGRWTIGAALNKGDYSWIKRGQDIKTGKIVALKFMEKVDVSLLKKKEKQVETELEAFQNIRHPNVTQLYTFNLNAQYPLPTVLSDQADKDSQKYLDTILLVKEYAPGAELFDILYYTSAMKQTVIRTYFKQIISAIETCHNANILHTNLTPQNLLLDANYNIKIDNFGVSKIIHLQSDAIITAYDTAKRYQAPELLMNCKHRYFYYLVSGYIREYEQQINVIIPPLPQHIILLYSQQTKNKRIPQNILQKMQSLLLISDYDSKCDIFSVGVILFILLAGYPPFNEASINCKWYKPLIQGKIEKFWKAHSKSPIAQIPDAKQLLTQMLCFDRKTRIDINGIKNHKWMQGTTLKHKELIAELKSRYRKAEKKRRQDVRKMNDLAQSLNPYGHIRWKLKLKLFPAELIEDICCPLTYLETKQKWYELYDMFEEAIVEKGKGKVMFNFDKEIMECEMKVARHISRANEQKETPNFDTVKFNVEIFESRQWKDRYLELEDSFTDIKENNQHLIFVVRIQRTEGDSLVFNKLKNGFMLTYCSSILKGLPDWARKLAKHECVKDVSDEHDIEKYAKWQDNYSKHLAADPDIWNNNTSN